MINITTHHFPWKLLCLHLAFLEPALARNTTTGPITRHQVRGCLTNDNHADQTQRYRSPPTLEYIRASHWSSAKSQSPYRVRWGSEPPWWSLWCPPAADPAASCSGTRCEWSSAAGRRPPGMERNRRRSGLTLWQTTSQSHERPIKLLRQKLYH